MPITTEMAYISGIGYSRRLAPDFSDNFLSSLPRFADEFLEEPFDKNECYFCRKKLNGIKHKTITSKFHTNALKICSNCYRLYKLFYPQITNKKIKPKSIIEIDTYIKIQIPPLRPIYRKKNIEPTTEKYIKPCHIKAEKYLFYDEYLTIYYKMKKRGCCFCQKRLIGKYIKLGIPQSVRVMKMCMDCDYLFRTIYREFKSKNGQTVKRIYQFISSEV